MTETKERLWRITVRLQPNLQAQVERASKKKRWSVNTFIEEAVMEKLAAPNK